MAEQTDHATEYYFFTTNIKRFSWKNKSKIVYPNCNSALKPISHGNDLPEEQELEECLNEHERTGSEACESKRGTERCSIKKPILIDQKTLNDLVRDLTRQGWDTRFTFKAVGLA